MAESSNLVIPSGERSDRDPLPSWHISATNSYEANQSYASSTNSSSGAANVRQVISNSATSRSSGGSGGVGSGGVLSSRVIDINENATGGMSTSQKIACYLAHLMSLVNIALVATWVSDELMGGGGVSWADGEAPKVFNWHPVLMITAFSFMTAASLAYRVAGTKKTKRSVKKVLHGMEWLIAATCMSVGVLAVVKSHNDLKSGYIANLYSLHSWIGCAVISLFAYQFLSALTAFALPAKLAPCISPVRRSRMVSFHRYLGNFVYIATAATILMGIQEKEGFVGCSYSVESENGPDVHPWKHYGDIPYACRISHWLGIMVFVTALTTSYALFNFPEYQEYYRSVSTRAD